MIQPLFELDRARLKPILKWAGGKRQLAKPIVRHIQRVMPSGIDTYYEPFVGGGAVFFALAALPWRLFRNAVLSDTNAELIAMYQAVRDDVDGVITRLRRLIKEVGLTKEAYACVRSSRPRSSASRAARMIYLNKMGFNGLYRVNKQGTFNVPFGKRKNPQPLDEPALRAASRALAGVELKVSPFETVGQFIADADFVYFDPPYLPASASANFSAYQAAGFDMDSQLRLVSLLTFLQNQGCRFLLSNADTPAARKIYKGFRKKRVLARRSINSDGKGRGPVGELLVWNK